MQKLEDTRHGFSLELPEGVNHRQLKIGYVLGHPSLTGLMMLLYHNNPTMEELKTEMYAGFYDDSGFNIQVDGRLNEISETMVLADYKGTAEGKPAKGFGIGLLSPHGGGFLLASIAAPDKFSEAHMDFIEDLARNVEFFEPEIKTGEDAWTEFLKSKTITSKEALEKDQPLAFQFDDGDTFSAIFMEQSKKHKQDTFESGEANVKGQWEVVKVMDQYMLRLLFFDGSEKQFMLRLQDQDTLLLNDEEWLVEA